MNVLLVEDDIELNNMLKKRLALEHINASQAFNGLEALDYIDDYTFDCIIMDIMMPKMNGLETLKVIRAKNNNTPILLLTAKDSDQDIINGLNAGADDYLVKPFSFQVLLARVKALVRRADNTVNPDTYTIGNIIVNEQNHTVRKNDEEIYLSHKEFELLVYFLRNKNIVLSREKIENNLYGLDTFNDSNVIDVHIRNLRKKIESKDEKPIIETIRGVGYIVRD